jgi:hypothetical protein
MTPRLTEREIDVHFWPPSLVTQIAARELPRSPVVNISPATQHVDALVQLTELYSLLFGARAVTAGLANVHVFPSSFVIMISSVPPGTLVPVSTAA